MKKALLVAAVTLLAAPAFAQEAVSSYKDYLALAVGMIMALAPIGCAIGMGMIASSGLTGISRNPAAQGKIFIPMIISLAFVEAFVIFGFVISFVLSGKI